jgi:AcrR family transcriptional regulator
MATRRTTTRTPRTGRRPGSSTTREAILAAARRQFGERGYAGATMRGIAAEAGVDASLVVHFFGNKVSLLGEAIEWPFDPAEEMPALLADGRRQVGRNLVALVVRTWDAAGTRHPVLTLLRAAMTEPQAAEMMSAFLTEKLFKPLLAELGTDQPELRTDLAISQLVGLAMVRHVVRLEPLASLAAEQVVAIYGPTVQRYLTGKVEFEEGKR